MLYKKPKDVRYVDMCIWIDQNYDKEDFDQNKFFEYLYHLSCMFAYKSKYFKYSYEYDDFGIFAATKLFLRYQDKNLDPIKSILNYIKCVIYPFKVQFQQQEYKENSQTQISEECVIDDSFKMKLIDQSLDMNRSEFRIYISQFHRVVKQCIDSTPFKKNSAEYNNLYVSCLLTFLNGITPCLSDISRINDIKRSEYIRENLYAKIYQSLTDKVILYHLDDSLQDYVRVITNKCKNVARQELSSTIYQNVYSDDIINDVHSYVVKGEEYYDEL